MNQRQTDQKPDIITLFRALVKTDMEHFTVPEDTREDRFADIMQAIAGDPAS